MKKKSAILIICFLIVSIIPSAQESERRIALVIGNADYTSSPLENPINDARDISEALGDLGFTVTMKLDCSSQEMFGAIREFGNELVRGGVGLFYYAGHGIQIRGGNYLIPVDADIEAEDEVRFTSIDVGLVLSKMESAGNSTNIVILDACRDNPFKRSFRTKNRGLAVVEAPRGSLVVYATAPGSVAAEGTGRNGIFTGALLRYIKTPGIDVEFMLRSVRRDVMAETGNAQTPWSSSSLTGNFYFAGTGVGAEETEVSKEKERTSTFSVEIAYGNMEIEVKTAGVLYLDGTRQGQIPFGGTARITDLETGRHDLEMHYDEGEIETKRVTVLKDRSIQVAFSYVEITLETEDSILQQTEEEKKDSIVVERPRVPENFVLVEAGTFNMGSARGESDEKPVHSVTMSEEFYISKYEVTQKEWLEVMGSNPSYVKGVNLPVESVSWYDAVEYCNRLSKKEGLIPCYSEWGDDIICDFSANGYRLPTEAEWEYAARGGNRSSGYKYAGGNSAKDVAWYNVNSDGKTHKVGQKKANELGLYDMSGNVWEWCWDWYGDYHSFYVTDQKGPLKGSQRVLRGVSWNFKARDLRVTNRRAIDPENSINNLGFRLVRKAE